jgi:hypothetical protein
MTHGGARPGAGRKKLTDTVPVCWRISKSSNNWIRSQAEEQGVTVREIIDELIKAFEDTCKNE